MNLLAVSNLSNLKQQFKTPFVRLIANKNTKQ
jgi:hypothetical protein